MKWSLICYVYDGQPQKFLIFFSLTPSKRLFFPKWELRQKCCTYECLQPQMSVRTADWRPACALWWWWWRQEMTMAMTMIKLPFTRIKFIAGLNFDIWIFLDCDSAIPLWTSEKPTLEKINFIKKNYFGDRFCCKRCRFKLTHWDRIESVNVWRCTEHWGNSTINWVPIPRSALVNKTDKTDTLSKG